MKSFVVCVFMAAGILLLYTGCKAKFVTLPPEVAQTEKATIDVTIISDGCIKESGVTSEALAKARKGLFGNDEGLKKFFYCYFHKSDIVTSDGTLNIDVALDNLPATFNRNVVRDILEGCKSQTGKDAIDRVYEIIKCSLRCN